MRPYCHPSSTLNKNAQPIRNGGTLMMETIVSKIGLLHWFVRIKQAMPNQMS